MFDVVVGASILHHLIDPVKAITAARRALKPGGIAIFFEPFEGFGLLRAAFELIVAHAEKESVPLDTRLLKLLMALILDYATRTGNDKTPEMFRYMDDKWLFTRSYFERAASIAGFSAVSCLALHNPDRLFHGLTVSLLRVGAGLAETDMPEWAWNFIDIFDRCLSADMKRDIIMEGAIVFQAARAPG
jgi:SAM-dependent methyltransferase